MKLTSGQGTIRSWLDDATGASQKLRIGSLARYPIFFPVSCQMDGPDWRNQSVSFCFLLKKQRTLDGLEIMVFAKMAFFIFRYNATLVCKSFCTPRISPKKF
jgi:hypothetical protein